jgi:hypothetical protein
MVHVFRLWTSMSRSMALLIFVHGSVGVGHVQIGNTWGLAGRLLMHDAHYDVIFMLSIT